MPGHDDDQLSETKPKTQIRRTLPSETACHRSFHSGPRLASRANLSRIIHPMLDVSNPAFCAAAFKCINCNLLAASRSEGVGCVVVLVAVVVAGEGAPRCLGVYGT